LSMKAPGGRKETLLLRVTREATNNFKPVVSATLHIKVVSTAFKVLAAPSSTDLVGNHTLSVTGSVRPNAAGTAVLLQRLVGTTWLKLTESIVQQGSVFTINRSLAAGTYRLRVFKNFSEKLAAGASKAFTVVVSAPRPTPPPPPPPAVVTTSLPTLVVGRPVTTSLTAVQGTAPYTWQLAGGSLPPGLTLATDGTVSGTPTTVGGTTASVLVTDAAGRAASGIIAAVVRPVAVTGWGYNGDGELGNGTATVTSAHATAGLPGTVSSISVGPDYSLALLTDGTVFAWGSNGSGQLGLGDRNPRLTPTQVPALSQVVWVAAGYDAAYAVTSSGAVYAWGADNVGQLGNGAVSGTPTLQPAVVPGLAPATSVAAGNQLALVLLRNGQVAAWGNGADGGLGNGTMTNAQTTPVIASTVAGAVAVQATESASYALLGNGTVEAWGLEAHGQLGTTTFPDGGPVEPNPQPVQGLAGATSLSCNGLEFCLATHADGTVSAWGYGIDGEMGNGSVSDNATAALVPGLAGVTQVATGSQTGYALRSDGTVLSWGGDSSNALGNGDPAFASTSTPAAVPGVTGAVTIAGGDDDAFAVQAG
jgi:alpha-tubulin suppressor-like RCC1 family protein